MTRPEFIERATVAAQLAKAAGALISVPIAVAQAALESNWGQSQLAKEANNFHGVKRGSSWSGDVLELPTQEWSEARQTFYTTIAKWRKYRDWQHAFADYGDLIQRVYPHAAAAAEDALKFLVELTARDYPKWATDPRYTEKVWGIVEQYNLLDQAQASDRLLVILAPDNTELAAVPIPAGARVRTISTVDFDTGRVYVRPELT